MSAAYEGENLVEELQPKLEAEVDAESLPADLTRTQLTRREPAAQTLGWNALRCALTPDQRRLLQRERPLAMVIEVPGPAWVEPIAAAARRLRAWDVIDDRDGSDRHRHRPGHGGDAIGRALSRGGSCVGVSPAPLRHLPTSLTGAADLWVTVAARDEAISATILAATGRRPRDLPPGAAARARTVVDGEVAAAPPFDSLHGYGAAKTWGDNLIADLAAWRRGEIAFSAISTRAVLASAPGLGKSTLVRSLAQATGLPLIASGVSAWFASTDGRLNSVIKAVDDVFNAARATSPAIIFLDEIDALPSRENLDSQNRDYWLPVITHILLALDSAVSGANAKTIVIGATNHPEHLDAALTRPGRLDTILRIESPDAAARAGILRAHLRGELGDEDLTAVAEIAIGLTGADLAEAVKRGRRAARVAGRPLAIADLIAAVAPADTRSPEDLRVVAIHEAGHAIGRVAFGYAVSSVSIIERGDAGGWTIGGGPSGAPDRQAVENYIIVLLCGRAAEQAILGPASTGAGGGPRSDLAKAAEWAAAIHVSYGLADSLIWRGSPPEAARLAGLDPGLRAQVDADLKRLFARALDVVTTRRRAVEAIAAALLRDRHLSGDAIQRIVAQTEGSAPSSVLAAEGGRR